MERQKSKAKAYRSWRPGITAKPTNGSFQKLEPKWMGPFLVIEKTKLGSFHLTDTEGRELEHYWNADNLHCFNI
jgi:hypothetical protein